MNATNNTITEQLLDLHTVRQSYFRIVNVSAKHLLDDESRHKSNSLGWHQNNVFAATLRDAENETE